MSDNLTRAQWAERCIQLFVDITGVDTLEDAVGDLIANLGHYARLQGIDYIDRVKCGLGHLYVEQIDENSLDPLPTITIIINHHRKPDTTGKLKPYRVTLHDTLRVCVDVDARYPKEAQRKAIAQWTNDLWDKADKALADSPSQIVQSNRRELFAIYPTAITKKTTNESPSQ